MDALAGDHDGTFGHQLDRCVVAAHRLGAGDNGR
jgi:hypothetical protein